MNNVFNCGYFLEILNEKGVFIGCFGFCFFKNLDVLFFIVFCGISNRIKNKE